MKWRPRKKISSTSPSSSISNAFPISWVSKIKLKREIPKAQQYPHMPLGGVAVERTRSDAGRVIHNTCTSDEEQTMPVGNEKHQMRKSVYIGGGTLTQEGMDRPTISKPAGRFRVCSRSPSRRETCKIKAVEEHKKKKKQQLVTSAVAVAGMESFAVVKHSQDPRHDFRDSMMEMIMDKGIKKPEEMEELLACYLTLNEDEYHDLIIKVFRQVWRELDDMRAGALNTQLQHLNMV